MTKNDQKAWEEMISEYLNEEGQDVSLVTGMDLKYFKLYCKIRHEFSKKYPKPKDLMEDDEDTVNIADAKHDPKAPLFIRALNRSKEMYDRVDVLQHMATEYEKQAIRLYAELTRFWEKAKPEARKVWRDSDIYEIVESYFKILRKYGERTIEEPYYFLHPQRKRRVVYEGKMLKRSTQIDANEIKVSLLEG
jgi:hypothetical protein